MDNQQKWHIENATAEKYESLFVPALFAPWAEKMVNAVDLTQAKEILDVACGTGIVARTVKHRLGNNAMITGIDINPAMLQVAETVDPGINWLEGNAEHLPFPASSFDVIFCQAALMFFPNQSAALTEMKRVMRPGSKIVLLVWGDNEAYEILGRILEEVSGATAAAVMEAPFVLKEKSQLLNLFLASGFEGIDITTGYTVLKTPSMEQWLKIELESWALSGKVNVSSILPIAHDRLQQFCHTDGSVAIPMKGHIVVASTNPNE